MNGEKFIQIKNKLLKENISANAFRVFSILLAHSKNGICYPSIRKMAEEYPISRKTMISAIKELEEHEIILKENRIIGSGKKTSNCYYLNEKFIVSKKEIKQAIPSWFSKSGNPDWLGQNIEMQEATDEERAEMEKLLEEYRDE